MWVFGGEVRVMAEQVKVLRVVGGAMTGEYGRGVTRLRRCGRISLASAQDPF